MPESKEYRLFSPSRDVDASHKKYKIRPATNATIDDVCEILFSTKHTSFEKRMYYARHHSTKRLEKDEEHDGKMKISFSDVYDEYTSRLALARALFYDVPELLDENGNPSPLAACLDRQQLYKALDFFFASFGVTLHESHLFAQLLAGSQALRVDSAPLQKSKSSSSTEKN